MGAEDKRGTPNSEIILPKECQFLPLVCQEEIREVFALIQRMKEEKIWDWNKVRTPEEFKAIIPQAREISQELRNALRPLETHVPSWSESWEIEGPWGIAVWSEKWQHKAWKVAWDIALATGSTGALESREEALIVVRNGARDAASEIYMVGALMALEAARAAAWGTFTDQPGFEKNPFLPSLRLYELGAARVKICRVNKKEKLFITFPLRVGEEFNFGVLVF